MVARQETVGACAVTVLAAVNEGLGTCLHMAASAEKIPTLHSVLNVPAGWVPVWCQLVGYPAESSDAGGQRPRLPFETLYFDGAYGTPFQEICQSPNCQSTAETRLGERRPLVFHSQRGTCCHAPLPRRRLTPRSVRTVGRAVFSSAALSSRRFRNADTRSSSV